MTVITGPAGVRFHGGYQRDRHLMPTRFKTRPATEPVFQRAGSVFATFDEALRFGHQNSAIREQPSMLRQVIRTLLDVPKNVVNYLRNTFYRLMAKRTLQPYLLSPRDPSTPGINRFAVIGDPGSGAPAQFEIARRMEEHHEQEPFASVLVLGDNIYEAGEIEKFYPILWKPYRNLFKKGIRFFPVLGNHDVIINRGDEQLNYWGAPRYYRVPLADGKVELFAIDTTVLLPKYAHVYRDHQAWAAQEGKKQLQWLNEALGDSKAEFKIVYGHYPMYSSGMHGVKKDSTVKMREMLEPMFVKHGVDVYMAGHEHHYERSYPIKGVTHILSGSAGKSRRIFFEHELTYPRAAAHQKFHFMTFDITDDGLAFQAITKDNEVIDEGFVPKKPKGLVALA